MGLEGQERPAELQGKDRVKALQVGETAQLREEGEAGWHAENEGHKAGERQAPDAESFPAQASNPEVQGLAGQVDK